MNAFFSRFLLLLLAAPLATGCLSSRYHVDDAELARLAQLPPERRCDAIRATQELSLRRSRAPRERVYVDPAPLVSTAVQVRIAESRRRIDPPRPTRVVTEGGPSGRPTVQVSGGGAARTSTRPVRSRRDGGDGDGLGTGAALGIAIVATAAVATGVFVLAGVEGARYDGWLGADAKRSLHLYRRDGQWLSIPAYALEPELAAWADGALLDEADGAPLERLGRAPLDRRGLSLVLEGGMRGLRGPGGDDLGGGARLAFGGFPHELFGLYGVVGFGAADGLFDVRYGLQAQLFAPALGRLHLGAWVEGGAIAVRADETDGGTQLDRGGYAAGGALVQLDLSTRLALTLRGGVWGDADGVAPELMLGLSVF